MIQKSVLLIEDNPAIRDAMIWLIENTGCAVTSTQDGQEALQKLDEGFRPDLIFLDLMMPVSDGWHFREVQQCNDTYAFIPTIITSARHDVAQTLRLHPNEMLLPKPFGEQCLLKLLEQFCA